MANYINPFTDIGFKRIFGQEFSKPLLIDFLNNLLIGEKRGEAKGLAKGLAKGRAEGLAKGREEGLAKGREETARNMKAKGLPVDLIAECSGLSPEEISQL